MLEYKLYIHSTKEKTKNKEIISIDPPEIIKIPVFGKFGNNPHPIISAGTYVRKYEVIAKSEASFSAPIHSPVSGIVEKIESYKQIDGSMIPTIFIKNDWREIELKDVFQNINSETSHGILKIIESAGIVGFGGAQFPAALKYDRKGKKVKSFILNGAECEPFLTSDYALMKYHTEEILEGALIIDKILHAEEIVVAFEQSNQNLIKIFQDFLIQKKYKKFRIKILPNDYPQGGELQLIRTVTGIEMPKGSTPLEKGIIVSNVGTVYAVYEAIKKKIPVIERIITVSGHNINQSGNYRIKIGTPVEHILQYCKISVEKAQIVSGGPMMSPGIQNLSAPMHKGSLGIVVLPLQDIKRRPCIWCGYCADICPMNLMPMKFDQLYLQKEYIKLERYDINDCIECGACEYICPSNISLIKNIKKGKIKLKDIQNKNEK